MLHNKALASILQKTYDESYLTCSTAAYYEIHNNEAEALRCWKSALDQIHDHRTNKLPANYTPRSEPERALTDSLRQLECQCKERIDILEALRLSREECPSRRGLSSLADHDPQTSNQPGKGWIGCGTIPAITYPELSRPISRPIASSLKPPSFAAVSSDQAIAESSDRDPSMTLGSPRSFAAGQPSVSTHNPSRSPSPERYTMRTTLRSKKPGEKSSGPSAKRSASKPAGGPGASKAASLAWSALSLTDKNCKSAASQPSQNQADKPRDSPEPQRQTPNYPRMQWDSNTRRLVTPRQRNTQSVAEGRHSFDSPPIRRPDQYSSSQPSSLSISAASSALNSSALRDPLEQYLADSEQPTHYRSAFLSGPASSRFPGSTNVATDNTSEADHGPVARRNPLANSPPKRDTQPQPTSIVPFSQGTASFGPSETESLVSNPANQKGTTQRERTRSLSSGGDPTTLASQGSQRGNKEKEGKPPHTRGSGNTLAPSSDDEDSAAASTWKKRKLRVLENLPQGIDEHAAKQIFNEIVVKGDEVRWADVAGLEMAKNALREAVVYPFLRPDLFKGLREPARGMLLFGPPGTGKTMLARAVATESRSSFFSISASSLTSKYLGESEKLVRALFALAKALAPSIIFVDEIDSLLSQRSGSGDHEASRRIKTEFLIQWSNLQRAAAGKEPADNHQYQNDANRVLVLAATNLPWAIDEAARRRFVRRQYIALPESETREIQIRHLLGQQKHNLADSDIKHLVELTDGFSGSDITSLAKDAAMGPIRSLGDALLHTTTDEIRPIEYTDFLASLDTIRPSVSRAGLEAYENWAKEFGERGG